MQTGVRGQPDINAHCHAQRKRDRSRALELSRRRPSGTRRSHRAGRDGLPATATRGLREHFRIDASHSNSYAAWKEMGSPQNPVAVAISQLENAGQLQLLNSPAWISNEQGSVTLKFACRDKDCRFCAWHGSKANPNTAIAELLLDSACRRGSIRLLLSLLRFPRSSHQSRRRKSFRRFNAFRTLNRHYDRATTSKLCKSIRAHLQQSPTGRTPARAGRNSPHGRRRRPESVGRVRQGARDFTELSGGTGGRGQLEYKAGSDRAIPAAESHP